MVVGSDCQGRRVSQRRYRRADAAATDELSERGCSGLLDRHLGARDSKLLDRLVDLVAAAFVGVFGWYESLRLVGVCGIFGEQ